MANQILQRLAECRAKCASLNVGGVLGVEVSTLHCARECDAERYVRKKGLSFRFHMKQPNV